MPEVPWMPGTESPGRVPPRECIRAARDALNHAYSCTEVERVETKHRQEVGGLWRCVSCGFAEGEVFRTETGRVITDEDFERLADADEQGWGEPDDSGG